MQTRFLTALAALFLLSSGAQAVPITGGIDMFGDFNPLDSNWNTTPHLDQATGLDFIGDDFTVDNVSGSFAAEGVAKNATGFMSDFQFNPLSPAPVNPLWSVGGFNFILESVTIDTQTTSQLILSGTGLLTHANYQDTYGTWSLHASAKVGRFFFGSATTSVAVPEPGTLFLFGAGLLGVALSRQWLRPKQRT